MCEVRGRLLQDRSKDTLVAVGDRVWVQPGLFCRVGFLERTHGGALRAPVFLGMVDGGN